MFANDTHPFSSKLTHAVATMLRHIPFQQVSCDFCFPSLRRPLGKVGAVWGRMGTSSPKLNRNFIGLYLHAPQVALPYALADTYPTHARHMFCKPALCWRCMAAWRTATIAIHCKDKSATRIKEQHGQSKPENNYSCHNPKTMQYSCRNPKR